MNKIELLMVMALMIFAPRVYAASWGKYIYKAITSSDTSKVRVYQASGEEFTITDNRYSGKVSTMTAGELTTSGDITPGDDVIGWYFYSDGGISKYVVTGMYSKPTEEV